MLRLIRVRFPNLIEHLLPMNIPAEVAARYARRKAMEETGLPSEKIGIVYISPALPKVSYVQAPMGVEKSEIDEVLGIKDIYRILLPYLKEAQRSAAAPAGRQHRHRLGQKRRREPGRWASGIISRQTASCVSLTCWRT